MSTVLCGIATKKSDAFPLWQKFRFIHIFQIILIYCQVARHKQHKAIPFATVNIDSLILGNDQNAIKITTKTTSFLVELRVLAVN